MGTVIAQPDAPGGGFSFPRISPRGDAVAVFELDTRSWLTGRVVIVTGASSGIGQACALAFADKGARVVLAARRADRLESLVAQIESTGAQALAVATDVTDESAVQNLFDRAVERFGTVDVLINNAGIAGKNAPTVDYPVDEWERVLRVNLTSQFLCCRAVAPHMVKAGYGRIVNIASVAGKEGNPNAVAYSASKAGVIALTKSLGKELAQGGVLVNCITPAAAKTAIFDQMTETHIQYMLSKIPMGRFVEVDEIAALACWLASEECSFSTGAVFDISGGRATY